MRQPAFADLPVDRELERHRTGSGPEFDKLIAAARAELDEAKRTQMYAEAQKMIIDDGGMVCFAIGDYLDGYGKKVMGTAPHPHYDMCDQRIAEKGWFA